MTTGRINQVTTIKWKATQSTQRTTVLLPRIAFWKNHNSLTILVRKQGSVSYDSFQLFYNFVPLLAGSSNKELLNWQS